MPSKPAKKPASGEVTESDLQSVKPSRTFITWAGSPGLVNLAIVFTDIIDSTGLNIKLAISGWDYVLSAHFARAKALLKKRQGFLIKTNGDAVMAAFKNSENALRFARELELDPGHASVRIRAGVHTGQVFVKTHDGFGPAVNLAARISEKPINGGIWVSDRVYRDWLDNDPTQSLPWTRHEGLEISGFNDRFTLWSLPPTKGDPSPSPNDDGETKFTLDDVYIDLKRLLSRLTKLLTGGLTAVERSEAGRILARLGDPRKGVGLKEGMPDIDWIDILASQFQMGGKGGNQAGDGFTCGLIQQPYCLSRYPITVAQYQTFVDAGGYDKKAGQRFWTKAGWKWRQSKKVTGPEDYAGVFQTPNHPRVGVSWFEARAFCQWLTERWQKIGHIPKQVSVRLPSEAEWERAARGKEGSAYPWGNDANEISQRCNMAKTGIGHTAAVGLFPTGHSECSVECLAGNVWEWCRTRERAYGKDYERKVRADEPDEENESRRTLRGGCWHKTNPHGLISSGRDFGRPGLREDCIGFRCVLVGLSECKVSKDLAS